MRKIKNVLNNNIGFFHFNDDVCNDFIKIFGQENIINFCCNGRRFKYYSNDRYKNLILEFSKLEKNNKYTCYSCLNENYLLANCKHNFCISCPIMWELKICPICRRKLLNYFN